MKQAEYGPWLCRHWGKLNHAMALYFAALLEHRANAETISRLHSDIVELLDEADQLGSKPKIK